MTAFFVISFSVFFPTLFTWAYFVQFSGFAVAKYIYSLGKVIQFGIPLAFYRVTISDGASTPTPRVSHKFLWDIYISFAIFLSIYLAYFFVLRRFPQFAEIKVIVRTKLLSFGIDSTWKYISFAVFYSVLHSGLEEYYWRGFVYRSLRNWISPSMATLVSSLAFMSHHVLLIGTLLKGYGALTWVFSLCVAIGGVYWCWLYQRTNSIYRSWFSHLVVDAAIFAIGYNLYGMAY